ncbi:MAG: excinuclease ABC subunit UvrA [Planctomycetota bacterium]|nr:excinuclease ABC subunit UvrA [Planctomycetota bacterium]
MNLATGRDTIVLEGVRVHNLQDLSLEIPLHQLVVITGISGSGKSSLAFETLAVEGQRRYIETLSPSARGLLDRLDRPDADRIESVPPTIAIRQGTHRAGARETVGTATEIHDQLTLLYAHTGIIVCPDCTTTVESSTSESIASTLENCAEGLRFQVVFEVSDYEPDIKQQRERLSEDGFRRLAVSDGNTRSRTQVDLDQAEEHDLDSAWVILDRLVTGGTDRSRIEESIEQAISCGEGRCLILIDGAHDDSQHVTLDGSTWSVTPWSTGTTCNTCRRRFARPEPRLFSFHSPLGACPGCRGFGSVPVISFTKLVPDPRLSLREGAIAAWTTPAYSHELDELIDLAPDYGIPLDVPFEELSPVHLELITHGVPERDFGGLDGFFDWLERHRYKLSVRVFLNRWRAYDTCEHCGGGRLQPDALAVHLPAALDQQERTIDQLVALPVAELRNVISECQKHSENLERDLKHTVLAPLATRLDCLHRVGLDYLTLDRPLRTLSNGEARRVLLTQALGSSLVNTLYVLDEPTAGLHATDVARLVEVIGELVDRGNSVVMVEHDTSVIEAADQIIDIGPAAGRHGGRLLFQGPPTELATCNDSVTGAYFSQRLPDQAPEDGSAARPAAGTIQLTGATRHNLDHLDVSFPLGQLVVVAGVSGSGKSSLVQETLYPTLCQALDQPLPAELTHDDCLAAITGFESLEQVTLVDASPIGRSARSIPATYLKAFDDIRRLFAATAESKQRGYTARQFSFNSTGGGRCEMCGGSGDIEVDMQFLADIHTTCPECSGRRFGREVLEITHRNRSIADVLDMTVEEAFGFFRGEHKIRRRLQPLRDVGLDYLPLGQPTTTLSGGESQRLKLASFLSTKATRRTLFLLDEPTAGLHPADVEQLLSCLDTLLAVGHSVVVIEHHLELIARADHVIELGPGGGPRGGQLIASGSPRDILLCADSVTGHHLSCYNQPPR